MEVERLGGATLDSRGRMLSPLRIRYADGRNARALVDDTAIVRLEPGSEAALEAYGARLVRPLMESLESDLLPRDAEEAPRLYGVEPRPFERAVEHALREWEASEPLAAR